MQCPSCHSKNREGRRYCGECGAALSIPCPACEFVNEPGEKFCGGCGQALGASSAVKPSPPPARERRVAEQPSGAANAERRQLTVMFCDLSESTALSERLDPEEMRDLLATYQDTCSEVVNRFDGCIARYIGDGLLVYFGYPRAHEDDAERAVRAGVGIVEAIRALDSAASQAGLTLAVRVGVTTGLVVVGDIGGRERREEMAVVGETPNIAARLQAMAEPNSVVIGSSTRDLVEGVFDLEDLGPQSLRGISRPVAAYRVQTERDTHSLFERASSQGVTPLVGRDGEVGLLLNRWQQAKKGEGQVVFLSGEAGIGKSRIIRGLRDMIEGEPQNHVLYYCSPYHTDTPFYPVVDQLARGFRIAAGDTATAKLDQLDSVLTELGLVPARLTPLLASLLSVPTDERYPPLIAAPQDVKRQCMEALAQIVGAMASQAPVLLIIEDLHWADPSTLESLSLMSEHLSSSRFLLIASFRPDYNPVWNSDVGATNLILNRLSRKETAEVVAKVAGDKSLPEAVFEQIVTKTDGVPLFIEELTKTVLESDLLVDAGDHYVLSGPLTTLAIPASLQDSLMARLDRLAPLKEVAQVASTLGRTFIADLLAAVSTLERPALDAALAQLIEADLLHRRGSSAHVTYQFKQALVQEAAYNSLLHKKRQELHLQIGNSLEVHFPQIVEAEPELLAHHFREADLPERAIPYALLAGDAAVARYASLEATARYLSALDMARSLPPTETGTRLQIQATLKLAAVAMNREHFERDLNNLEDAQKLAESIGDNHRSCQIQYWIGRTHYVLGRLDLSVEYAEKALQMAESLGGDDEVSAGPVNLLARIHCMRGEPSKGTAYAARNVSQMHNLGNRIEEAAIAGVHAFACGIHGQFTQAFESADRGVVLAQEIQHLPTLAACYFYRGTVKGWYGELNSSVSNFKEAITYSDQAGDVFRKYLAHGWRGEAYLLAEQLGPAKEDLSEALALSDRIGTQYHRGAFEAFLARVHLLEGDVARALPMIEKALAIATDTTQDWSRSIALRIYAEVLLVADVTELPRAEGAVGTAIEIQRGHECQCELAWSHLVLAKVLSAKGDPPEAGRALDTATQLFERMGMAGGLERARAAAVA